MGSAMTIHVAALLKKYGLRPKKGLGQNFLSDPAILEKVTRAGGVTSQDTVLEIGPGLGTLTRTLAQTAAHVVAVEIDEHMFGPLGEVLAQNENVRLVQGDILSQSIPELMSAPQPYVVIANIPYYITSAIIRHLLESGHPPQRLALTVQREVAERMCAEPPGMSLLALSVQVYGSPGVVFRIPAGAFYPPPKVDSAVVMLEVYPEPLIAREKLDLFFKLAKAGFSQKRKTLRNALSAGMHWSKEETAARLARAGIDPQRRAETLNLFEWRAVVEAAEE